MMIDVTFPGGQCVDAHLGGHTIHTDQREKHGGGGSGPPPFDLFLASIATCMGFYALRFCQQRELETESLRLSMETQRDPDTKMIGTMTVQLELPADFPAKYVRAIERSMDQCTVKMHMFDPPAFVIETEIAASAPLALS